MFYCRIYMKNDHLPTSTLLSSSRQITLKFTEEVHDVPHKREQIHYQSTPSLTISDFRARVFKDYNRESSHFTSAKIHSEMILSHGIADSIQIYIIHRICWLCASVVQHPLHSFVFFLSKNIQFYLILFSPFDCIRVSDRLVE